MPQMEAAQHFLYEQVEGMVKGLISSGTLKAGDRVPSLRNMSRQARVSISTVMQAYLSLEDQGYVEARPKSGYYVRERRQSGPSIPRPKKSATAPRKVQVGELATEIFAAAHEPGIVALGTANPSDDLLPAKALTRAMTQVAARDRFASVRYAHPTGVRELRRQIAVRNTDLGSPVSPDEVLITAGATEALAIALRSVAERGDVIAVESPTYFAVLQLIERLGMLALEIRTDPEEGLCLDSLEFALDSVDVKAVLVVGNFHNPLGSRMPDERKRELVECLAARDVALVEDDVYGDLGFDEPRPRTARCFDSNGLVLTCSSFSKTIAPGYRVGWLLPGRYAKHAVQWKHSSTLCTATLPQLAMAEFLRTGHYDRFLRGVRRSYEEQVAKMRAAIAQYFPIGTRATQPRGGFVIWVELPKGIDGLALFYSALERRVSITPGVLFSPTRKFGNYIRLCAGQPWTPAIDDALKTLGRLAADMQTR